MWPPSTSIMIAKASLGLCTATSVAAQDFADVQVMANRVLLSNENAAQQRRLAEQRRVQELDQRARQQEVFLQQQSVTVQQLGGELQKIKNERQLIDLASGFEAAVLAGRGALVRPLLADIVTVELSGQSGAPTETMAASDFVDRLSAVRGGVLPRSNQRVRVEGDHAVLRSAGYAWNQQGHSAKALDRLSGEYEYGFRRMSDDWKIDRIVFRLNN